MAKTVIPRSINKVPLPSDLGHLPPRYEYPPFRQRHIAFPVNVQIVFAIGSASAEIGHDRHAAINNKPECLN